MSIKTYWPTDDESTIYIESSASLADIQNRISEKWGNINAREITIESEYIHTNCLTYDLYDANDWTKFIIIRLNLAAE
jgi:hypothetical protein